MMGRHYHRRYGYPWRWAITAELAWRLEHLPLGPLARCAYGWRKEAERCGATALPTTGGASMSILVPFAVTSDMGVRVWMAEDADHAREQHEDAFPDEPIESVAAA